MMGILIARLLSGVVTQYTSWRTIYWLSVGLQYLIFVLLWLFMPDYPSTNPSGLNYFRMLWSILVMLTKHPVLVQACLVCFFISATFTNFWTTLTFLLSDPPYNYDSLVIGLFALVGIAGMLCSPIYARLVIDRFVPLFTVVAGLGWALIGICIGTYTGTYTVAGPILQAFFADLGMQTCQIALRSSIFTVEPKYVYLHRVYITMPECFANMSTQRTQPSQYRIHGVDVFRSIGRHFCRISSIRARWMDRKREL